MTHAPRIGKHRYRWNPRAAGSTVIAMSKPPRKPPTGGGQVNAQIHRAGMEARPKAVGADVAPPPKKGVSLGSRPAPRGRDTFKPLEDDAPLTFDDAPGRPAATPPAARPTRPDPPAATPSAAPPPERRKPIVTPGSYTVARVARDVAAEQAQALVGAVTDSVVDRLIVEADRRGGRLSGGDLRAMRGDLRRGADALEPMFRESFEDFGEVIGRVRANRARIRRFERLIVKRIADLFHGDDAERLDDGRMSRRLLPGFLKGIDQMLGPGPSVRFREEAKAIVERMQAETGARFAWDAVYDDPEARRLVARTQILIAPFYKDLERRKDWQRNIINGNLAPFDPDAGHCEDERGWEFRLIDFIPFTRRLFSGLDAALSDIRMRGDLSAELGEPALREAAGLLKRLKG